MVLYLFNTGIYVFLLLCLCILIVCLCMATLTEGFPCFFLSCKANVRAKLAKTGQGPHSSYFCVVLCVVCFVSFCVLFLCICVLYYCHRLATQLQLTNIYHIVPSCADGLEIWGPQPPGILRDCLDLYRFFFYLFTFTQKTERNKM